MGGFWKGRGLLPHPSSFPACRYDTQFPSDTWVLSGWPRPLSLRMRPAVLGITTQAHCSGYWGGGESGLQGRGPYSQACPQLPQRPEQQILTLFAGRRCHFGDTHVPALGPAPVGLRLSVWPFLTGPLTVHKPSTATLCRLGFTLHARPPTSAAFSRPNLPSNQTKEPLSPRCPARTWAGTGQGWLHLPLWALYPNSRLLSAAAAAGGDRLLSPLA